MNRTTRFFFPYLSVLVAFFLAVNFLTVSLAHAETSGSESTNPTFSILRDDLTTGGGGGGRPAPLPIRPKPPAVKVPSYKPFTLNNFRHNVQQRIGNPPSSIKEPQAHHILPNKFRSYFARNGINVHDPKFGTWVEKGPHLQWTYAYNKEWERFASKYPNATFWEILNQARHLGQMYGFKVWL